MKPKDVRLYNVMFPVWFLVVFPATWLIVLPVNFLVDSAVVLLTLRALSVSLKEGWKKSILPVWGLGFLCDFAGTALLTLPLLLPIRSAGWDEFVGCLSGNPFQNVWALLYTLFAVAVSGLLIYVCNRKWSFRRLELDPMEKKRLARNLAIFTAPYTFLIPAMWLAGM